VNLAGLEGWWWSRVTGEDGGDSDEFVRGDARLDATGRVDVYRSMYFARIAETLAADHAALRLAVGDDWDAMARAYIQAFPSAHASIARMGDRLPEFLSGWLSDLALLERARSRVFEAADAEPVEMEPLRSLAPEAWPTLVLSRIPASERITVRWEVDAAWDAADRGEVPAEPALSPGQLLVWRLGATTRVAHRRVTGGERALLDAFDQRATFGDACAALSELGDDAAPTAARALIALVQAGVLTT
jgi:hypothetical protein